MLPLFAPILAQALTLGAADRTELRGREFDGELDFDAQTSPSVTLALTTPRTSYSLTYAPTITLFSFQDPDAELVVFHNLTAAANLRFRRTTLSLMQSAGYGRRNLRLDALTLSAPEAPAESPDPTTPPPDPSVTQTRAVDQVVRIGSSNTSLGLSHVLSRRWGLSEFVGYSVSGGLNNVSRAAYPLQRQGYGGVGLGYALTRNDGLSTRLDGRYSVTEPDEKAVIVSLEEVWSHRFSTTWTGSVGAGLAWTRFEDDDLPGGDTQLLPAGSAGMDYSVARELDRFGLTFNVSVSPVVDRTTGGVDQRVLWSAAVSRTRGFWTLVGSTSGTRSLGGNSEVSLTSYGASVGAIYQIAPELSVDTGLSVVWQDFEIDGVLDDQGFEPIWAGFVGLTLSPRPLDL